MSPDAKTSRLDTADSRPPTWTVLAVLRWTTDYLAGKGVESPRLDAEVLLADLLGIGRVQLYLEYDRPLSREELAGYRERIKRRAAREPAAYIIGRREFYSLDFQVGPAVLVPRPETELLVDEALALARNRWPDQAVNVLDLGTGSGAIAVALAHHLPPGGRVRAVDLSPAALDVARANADRHGLAGAIEFISGDLFEPLADASPFHLICGNLPYVPSGRLAEADADVRDYEPQSALDGGPDGLIFIRRAVAEGRDFLAPGGAMLLEIWPDHGPELERLAAAAGWNGVRILPDLAGRDRVAVLDTGA